MAWGSKNTIESSTSVGGTEEFSSWVDLNPGETVHFQVSADFPASPTDNLEVRVYGTLDASSETSDDEAIQMMIIDNSNDPGEKSISIWGYYKVRLGFVRDGTTDNITVSAYERCDGVDL
jgi:hypothetical protein